MEEALTFLVSHGYLVIFMWVLLDQAGLPLPAVPLLMAAGALAALGELSLLAIFAVTLAAAVPIDYFWYWLGKLRGGRVLTLLCMISMEPDYCVRNTEAAFYRFGPYSLVVAKFVPGLQTLAPPMSGMTGMALSRFLLLDAIGTVLWTATFVGIGYLFAGQLETVVKYLAEIGMAAGVGVGAVIFGYFAYKFVQRRRFLKTLEMRRLDPLEANQFLKENKNVHIIDIRHSYDINVQPEQVPGAINVPMEAMERHAHQIPKDDDIIVYCT